MNILLVDDEIIAIKGIIAEIDRDELGIQQIYAAYSVEQAIDIIINNSVQLVIADIEMPGHNGMELLEWVNTHDPLIVTSFLTCHAEFDYAKDAIRLKAYDYLTKPASPQDISSLVKRMIIQYKVNIESDQMHRYGKHWLLKKTGIAEKKVGARKSREDIVADVERYILDNLSGELTMENIAAKYYMNGDYLNRIFKNAKQISINKFIIRERMALAARLLCTSNLSVNNVAEEVGYFNYANFNNMFKKIYGVSPGQYKKHQKDE